MDGGEWELEFRKSFRASFSGRRRGGLISREEGYKTPGMSRAQGGTSELQHQLPSRMNAAAALLASFDQPEKNTGPGASAVNQVATYLPSFKALHTE